MLRTLLESALVAQSTRRATFVALAPKKDGRPA
jgi:hypothetical protein